MKKVNRRKLLLAGLSFCCGGIALFALLNDPKRESEVAPMVIEQRAALVPEAFDPDEIPQIHPSGVSDQTMTLQALVDDAVGKFSGNYRLNRANDVGQPGAAIAADVDSVVGLGAASVGQRFEALQRLRTSEIPEEHRLRLLDYLADAHRESGMNAAAERELINDLLIIFHDKPVLDDRYLATSRFVIGNSEEDEVIRDYTLQGLSRGYAAASSEQAEFIRSVFWGNLNDAETSLAGTSLHALNRVRQSTGLPTAELERLGAEVRSFVVDDRAYELTRVSAIQMAGALGATDLAEQLSSIALSNDATISERIAALATSIHFGDRSLLPVLAESSHPLLARAASRFAEK